MMDSDFPAELGAHQHVKKKPHVRQYIYVTDEGIRVFILFSLTE